MTNREAGSMWPWGMTECQLCTTNWACMHKGVFCFVWDCLAAAANTMLYDRVAMRVALVWPGTLEAIIWEQHICGCMRV